MKHELDEVLQHYGVKGMKWGVKRSEEELAEAEGGGAGGGDGSEENEDSDIEEFFDDLIDSTKDITMKAASKFKKSGISILEKIFGKSTKTTKVIDSNFEGKVGRWKVSKPFNKDGSPKKSNKKIETHTTKIKTPSNASIERAAKAAAEKYKRRN